MTLTPFSRSHEGLDCWKIACLLPISSMNGWILTKLVHLNCWDMELNWLDFGDPDPIFKVTLRLRFLENGLSAPVLWRNGWILTKLAQLYCWDMQKHWLYFGDLDPIFKVTQGLRLLKIGLSAPYLLKEWIDFLPNLNIYIVVTWKKKTD